MRRWHAGDVVEVDNNSGAIIVIVVEVEGCVERIVVDVDLVTIT